MHQEQQRAMIRTLGRQRLKSMGRELQKPVRGDKDPIQQLEFQMQWSD
jgi:hypothetical protein